MGTNASYGIKKDGKLKSMYCHYDGYISGLGRDLIDTIKFYGVDKISNAFDKIKLVSANGKPPTDKEITICEENGWCDFTVSTGKRDDWYCLLRLTQGDLGKLLDADENTPLFGYYSKMGRAYYDYLIDLDKNIFYVLRSRKKVASFPLNEIPKYLSSDIVDCLTEQMETNVPFEDIFEKYIPLAEKLPLEKDKAKKRLIDFAKENMVRGRVEYRELAKDLILLFGE